MPGGSSNALSCDLGGKEPLHAAINIVRGNIVQGDLLRVDFQNQGRSILGTTLVWGFFSDVVEKSEQWRQ